MENCEDSWNLNANSDEGKNSGFSSDKSSKDGSPDLEEIKGGSVGSEEPLLGSSSDDDHEIEDNEKTISLKKGVDDIKARDAELLELLSVERGISSDWGKNNAAQGHVVERLRSLNKAIQSLSTRREYGEEERLNIRLDIERLLRNLKFHEEEERFLNLKRKHLELLRNENSAAIDKVRKLFKESNTECREIHRKNSSISDQKLGFQNQNKAFETIARIFKERRKYWLRRESSVAERVITLLPDTDGMGKSAFAMNVENFLTKTPGTGFNRLKTVVVPLKRGSLLPSFQRNGKQCDKFLKTAIHDALVDMEIRGEIIRSSPYGKETDSSYELLMHSNHDGGERLIVLDNIGAAFDGEASADERLFAFKNFCDQIVYHWFHFDRIFFIFSGRGDIFELPEMRRAGVFKLQGCELKFEKVFLDLLEGSDIVKIFTETTIGVDGVEQSLKDYYKIGCETEIVQVAGAVKAVTNGFPKAILQMLESCRSKEELLVYRGNPNEIPKDEEFRSDWPVETVRDLLDAIILEERLDLTRKSAMSSLPRHKWAEKLGIHWNGEINSARIFCSPIVRDHLSRLFSPLKQMLLLQPFDEGLREQNGSNVIYFLLKRLQEMFNDSQSIGVDFWEWFGGPCIANMGKITFSSRFQALRTGQNREYLQFEIGHTDKTFLVTDEVSEPRGALFMKDSTSGNLGKVTIGIVLKSRIPEEDANSFDSELAWFSKLVCRKKTSDKLSNILLVADASELEGTGLTKRGKHYSVIDARKFPDITEAIRLDLNTRELRWNFFGLHEKTEMGEKLRSIIDKCFARVM